MGREWWIWDVVEGSRWSCGNSVIAVKIRSNALRTVFLDGLVRLTWENHIPVREHSEVTDEASTVLNV